MAKFLTTRKALALWTVLILAAVPAAFGIYLKWVLTFSAREIFAFLASKLILLTYAVLMLLGYLGIVIINFLNAMPVDKTGGSMNSNQNCGYDEK